LGARPTPNLRLRPALFAYAAQLALGGSDLDATDDTIAWPDW
jgi:hypothetical protein